MKTFLHVPWDSDACIAQLDRFRQFLGRSKKLSERKDILPFFRASPQLSAYIGNLCLRRSTCDLVSYEYDLFGDFASDMVIGDSRRKSYVFVEFEGAGPNSLFRRQGKKATREWAPAFTHGYAQLVDWFAKLHDQEKTEDFANRFGARSVEYTGLLVVGREKYLETGERRRLEWWRSNVVVASKLILCVTFDELLADLTAMITKYERDPRSRRRKS